jgi:hypothetical protein
MWWIAVRMDAFLVLAKALSRAAQRSDGAIPRLLEQSYPKIARRAGREKALIYWGDKRFTESCLER